MLKSLLKIVSFALMAASLFILATLAGSTIYESQWGEDSSWTLHWIHLHRHNEVYSVEHIYVGELVIFLCGSVCLAWILSGVLARLRARKGHHEA
jgi:hypothetical protein